MLGQAADLPQVEPIAAIAQDITGQISPLNSSWVPVDPTNPLSVKAALRTSLRASTLDGVFATMFSNIAGGVLLSNFLVELKASPMEIGFLSSIPMLANLIQPLGAYLSSQTTSRHWYGLWIFGPSRLLWLLLTLGIALVNWNHSDPHQLILWTLGLVVATHFLGALGGASWLSWLTVLVPRRLRGRYFGIRNSAASLTSLLCVPLAGLAVSKFPGGTLQGYGAVLLLGVILGLVSLVFQCFMIDVNPQTQQQSGQATVLNPTPQGEGSTVAIAPSGWLQDGNFLVFLLHFALWMFAVNVSAPFFNVYLLDDLSLDVSWVTLYSSLSAGANLVLMMVWGRLADRFGNRPILILVGLLVALTPLLWLGVDRADSLSVWVWLPLLHILGGGTWAAMDLCNNNLQMEIATPKHQATYFAVVAAVAGVSGALGTTAGGLLDHASYGGLPGVFALSSVLRLIALIPLVFVVEHRSQPIRRVLRSLLPQKP